MKVLVLAITIIFLSNVYAQQVYTSTKGESTFLSEASAVIKFDKNKLFVDFAKSMKSENESLLKDDEILFLNGKKIKSLKDFTKEYAETKVGNELKFGIKRNGDTKIIVIKKGDETKNGGTKLEYKVSNMKDAEKIINDLKKQGNVKIITREVKADSVKK